MCVCVCEREHGVGLVDVAHERVVALITRLRLWRHCFFVREKKEKKLFSLIVLVEYTMCSKFSNVIYVTLEGIIE